MTMSDVVLKKKIGDYKIKVVVDENPSSPREDDNLGTMVCFHRNYNLGDKHDYRSSNYDSWDEMEKDIKRNENICIILPVYMYDHSGITINTTGFSCPWDSGRIGFIFVSKEKVREWFGVKRIDSKLRDRVKDYLVSEIDTYDKYLTGSVYGYKITKKVDGEKVEIDSCWGFYDSDECMEEAEGIVSYDMEHMVHH
jgi:hypothetical protein